MLSSHSYADPFNAVSIHCSRYGHAVNTRAVAYTYSTAVEIQSCEVARLSQQRWHLTGKHILAHSHMGEYIPRLSYEFLIEDHFVLLGRGANTNRLAKVDTKGEPTLSLARWHRSPAFSIFQISEVDFKVYVALWWVLCDCMWRFQIQYRQVDAAARDDRQQHVC